MLAKSSLRQILRGAASAGTRRSSRHYHYGAVSCLSHQPKTLSREIVWEFDPSPRRRLNSSGGSRNSPDSEGSNSPNSSTDKEIDEEFRSLHGQLKAYQTVISTFLQDPNKEKVHFSLQARKGELHGSVLKTVLPSFPLSSFL